METATSIISLWEILIPAIMICYGVYLLLNPPKIDSGKGFGTEYTKQSRKTWEEGNKFGGILLVIFGAIIGLVVLIHNLAFPDRTPHWFIIFQVVIEVVLIFSIVPLMNRHVKKKFNLK